MCGIFGIISHGGVSAQRKQVQALLRDFYRFSESRGKEASGLAYIDDGQIDVVKASVRGRDFFSLPSAKLIAEKFYSRLINGEPFGLMGHTRMVTNGSSSLRQNNQPVLREGVIAIHNGIIVNDEELWRQHPEISRNYEVDTEILVALIARQLKQGQTFSAAAADVFARLKGANSVALASVRSDRILLLSTNGSMYYVEGKQGFAAFASERAILEKIIESSLRQVVDVSIDDIRQLQHGSIKELVMTARGPIAARPGEAGDEHLSGHGSERAIIDHSVNSLISYPQSSTSTESKLESLTKIDWPAIRNLKRCSRCVLPETFPFIKFNSSGVCNFCEVYQPLQLKGEHALRDVIGRDSSGTRPRVLFPLSGGRDSCFGLHKLVKDFQVRPVAYTYDWGMVTDLARRNISRMCGELSIEHVLISANIQRKREFIRKNVAAWLKSPHLGTIPLFMAGDKQFFYYANMLKKEMQLSTILFSMNPLERTDFKMGFCEIDESYQKTRHYDPKLINKVRLASFYAAEFIRNPKYINSSLWDSVFAYISYYLIPKNYVSLYDYIPWIEQEVESTLLDQYGWEISSDTNSTWRIGDGTAAFYNYVYLTVAGFSENDTFRSNQIREGFLTREDAMSRIYDDNRIRLASIIWYFDSIGLSAIDAAKVVEQIPKLYRGGQ